jgi:hypothetical protein
MFRLMHGFVGGADYLIMKSLWSLFVGLLILTATGFSNTLLMAVATDPDGTLLRLPLWLTMR